MISRNGNGGFFAANYQWLALAAGILALAGGGAYYFLSTGVDPDETAAATVRSIEGRKASGDGVKPAQMEEFQRATRLAKKPETLVPVTEKEGSFLASERRVFCAKAECAAPIPGDARTCPVCGFEQPEEKKVVFDTDEDGMPDEWEKRYGFNVNDPGDAALDKDGDGFTNLEEYEAKTDPTNPKDHPDYLDSLKVQPPFRETLLPFYFRSAMKTPSGMKLTFRDPKKRRYKGAPPGFDYSVFEGKEIGDTGYTVTKFEAKTAKRKIKGSNVEKTVDVSEVKLVRRSDGKELVLVLEEKKKPVDIQAKLVYTRGTVKEFEVVPGDEIDLNGSKYRIKEVKTSGKGGSVSIENPLTGKIRVLEALDS